MRILKSFDTKLDLEEFAVALERYWEGNVVLMRKHWIKLLLPFSLVILSIFALLLMLYTIYINTFDENKVIFWIIAILYMYTTISWCLFVIISIILRIRYWNKMEVPYIDSPTNLVDVKKKWFDKFMRRTFWTFLIHSIVLIWNIVFPFVFIKTTGVWNVSVAVWIFLINLVFLFLLNRVMYLLIEYEMTFNICTIDWFTTYNQKWFFKTDSMKIEASAIKVIKSSKEWILWALFRYWNLYIYTDWDLNIKWGKNLELTYVPAPSLLAKKLNSIFEKARENKNNQ